MGDVLSLVVAFVVSRALTFVIVVRDERRLTFERLDRAWPVASLWAAVYQFGLFAIPVHFARTRRSVSGLLLGLAWAAAVLVLTSLALTVSDSLYEAVG